MGVLGLERYLLTTHPNTCPRVSIADLAEKYKKQTGRDSAVAVVDAGNRLYAEVGRQEKLYGGQYKQLSEQMVDFARQLQAAGVTPVFFFKGAPSEGRLNVWQDRRQDQLARVQKAYDKIATWGVEPPGSAKDGRGDEQCGNKVKDAVGVSEAQGNAPDTEVSIKEVTSASNEASPEGLTSATAEASPEEITPTTSEASPEGVTSATAEASPEGMTSTTSEASPEGLTSTTSEAPPEGVTSATAEASPEGLTSATAEASPEGMTPTTSETSPEGLTSATAEASPKRLTSATAEASPEGVTSPTAEASPKGLTSASAEASPEGLTSATIEASPEGVTPASAEAPPEVVTPAASKGTDQDAELAVTSSEPSPLASVEVKAEDADLAKSEAPEDQTEDLERLQRAQRGQEQQRRGDRGRGYSRGRSSYPRRGGYSDQQRGRSDFRGQPRGGPALRRGGRGAPRGSHQHQQRTAQPSTSDVVMPSLAFECVKLALKQAGFKVLTSVGEVDVEMGHYCRQQGCFALLSRDTDFVAMETAHYYLSVAHLDQDMTTLHFDRDAITKALGLNTRGQLPLLMAMLPNGCVPAPYLVPLHIKAAGRSLDSLDPKQYFRLDAVIQRLAQFARNKLWHMTAADAVCAILQKALTEYPSRLLYDFSKQLGFENSWDFREALRLQLEASLVAHDYTPPEGEALPAPRAVPLATLTADAEKVLLAARTRHVQLLFATPIVLALLEKRVWEENCSLDDPALPAGCCSAAALQPLRRRLYGVLLHGDDAQAARASVREFIVLKGTTPGAKPQPADVAPVPVDVSAAPHPGLLALWGGGCEADAQWRLLAWCLCPSQPGGALLQCLRALPPRHVIPAAAMFLLRHNGTLAACIQAAASAAAPVAEPASTTVTPEEDSTPSGGEAPEGTVEVSTECVPEYRPTVEEVIRLFARTCVQAGRLSAAEVELLLPPRPRRLAVHLSALYMRTCSTLVVLNDALGALVPVDEVQPAGFFDGKLFHTLVAGDTSDDCDNASVEALVRAACLGAAPCGPCSCSDGLAADGPPYPCGPGDGPAANAEVEEVAEARAEQHSASRVCVAL